MLRRISIALSMIAFLAFAGPARAQTQSRLHIVLLLDASTSMAKSDPDKLMQVAAKLLSDLSDARDRLTIMSFGDEVARVKVASGHETDALHAAIDTLGRGETCSDYGLALNAAATELEKALPSDPRGVVVMLTDGPFETVNPSGGCARLGDANDVVRTAMMQPAKRAATRLKNVGARLFAIGLGDVAKPPSDSVKLLAQISETTGGRFVAASRPAALPKIFANVFGGLVGAPVISSVFDLSAQATKLSVPEGADRLHVIVLPGGSEALDAVKLTRDGTQVPWAPTRGLGVYRIAQVTAKLAGAYSLTGAGSTEVVVVPELGLALAIEGVPTALPEGSRLTGKVTLVNRRARPAMLPAKFLTGMSVSVSVLGKPIFRGRLNAKGEVKLSSRRPVARGDYTLSARASNALGWSLAKANAHAFSVAARFAMTIDTTTIRFDGMAEEGAIISRDEAGTVTLAAPEKMPTDITLKVTFPDSMLRDMRVSPTESIVFGPQRPRKYVFELAWKTPRALRSKSHHYSGIIKLEAIEEDRKRLAGNTAWQLPVNVHLRQWTLWRWLREYQTQALVAAAALSVSLYAIRRRRAKAS